jgi:gamma-glutamyl hercynylcysteine S-oxide hydrolase
MCRHLAYVGPPVALDALLLAPPHSLLQQATAPRHQLGTHDNPDGFGVGWYLDGAPGPERYRTAKPLWADERFPQLAPQVRSGAVLGAVRNATPGSVIDVSGNAPFASGPYLFSHNGYVAGYRTGVADELRARTSSRRLAGIGGDTDSEALFALVLDSLDEGHTAVEALVSTVATARELGGGYLNLLLADGRSIAATAAGNSLFVLARAGARIVASEPYDDDPAWAPVPDGSAVVADATGIHTSPLPEDRP